MAEQVVSSADDDDDDDDDDEYIELTEDGGVLKKIILSGDDDKLPLYPPKHATVECHYIGKLMETGQEFDSSRNKKKPFQFILGENLNMFNIAIPTMKINEICIIKCSSKYGYGSNEKQSIPPNSWLIFEIELIGWNEWQILNNNHDLKKKVIINGYKSLIAKPDDIINLSYKGYIASINYIFDEKNEINVICDDDIRFPEGFHIALQNMEQGEHAIIDILDYKLAFGAEGNIDLNIPYFAEISYEIHIKHIEIAKHMNEYNELEKIEKAKQYKVEGNKYFGEELFDAAIKKYNKSLLWINSINSINSINAERIKIIIDVNNNMSLISMKRCDYDKVIEFTLKVLIFDDKNIKALSRSGHAKIKQHKYIEAKIDLKKAKSMDRNNSYINKLLQIAINKIKQQKAKQRKQYHSMFGYRPQKT